MLVKALRNPGADNNIKTGLERYEQMDYITMAQGGAEWRNFVNTETDFLVP
jgi:hypothetical protein